MSLKVKSEYQLLLNKEIYAILDGDTKFEEYKFDDNSDKISIAISCTRRSANIPSL